MIHIFSRSIKPGLRPGFIERLIIIIIKDTVGSDGSSADLKIRRISTSMVAVLRAAGFPPNAFFVVFIKEFLSFKYANLPL
jgi:hypothetical protein